MAFLGCSGDPGIAAAAAIAGQAAQVSCSCAHRVRQGASSSVQLAKCVARTGRARLTLCWLSEVTSAYAGVQILIDLSHASCAIAACLGGRRARQQRGCVVLQPWIVAAGA